MLKIEPDFKFGNCLMLRTKGFFEAEFTESVDVAALYSIRKLYQELGRNIHRNKNMKTSIFVNEVAEPRSMKLKNLKATTG